MIKQFFLLSISILLISGFSNLYADGHGGDATKGKKIFKKCGFKKIVRKIFYPKLTM